MGPKNLPASASPTTLWSETTYTHARLAGDANSLDFAPAYEPLVKEIEETQLGQRATWRGAIAAQARCDFLNGELDDLVVDLADTLFFVVRDRKSPRMLRYFRRTPYSIVRLALSSELEEVGPWPGSLQTEPEEALSAFAPRLTEVIEKANAALVALSDAQSARTDFRVRVITPLVGRLNDARLKLYGQLATRAEERKLGKSWPDGFFKVTTRRSAEQADEPEPEDDPS